jgi:hypothetical protein
MTSDHVKEYNSRGKTYFYFRPPKGLREKFADVPARLHAGTRAEAEARAAAILEGERPPRPRMPSERLYRRVINEYVGGHLLATARSRAAKRNLPFEINREHLVGLLKAQDYCCAVSGLPFEFELSGKTKGKEPFRPSIDRVNSREGYVPGNCRIVLCLVNIALGTWGEKTFVKVARAVAQRNRRERDTSSALV